MVSDEALNKIAWHIQHAPGFEGVMVGFYGNGMCSVIGYPSSVTPNSANIAVVVEEVVLDNPISPPVTARATPDAAPPQVKHVVTNRSKLGAELVGAGVSCGLTLVSAAGVALGAAGEVPTGGASTLLIIASWTSFAAGAIQCGNGLVRIGAALNDLDGDTLARWDENSWYSTAILVVDAAGVAAGLTMLPFAVRNLWGVIARRAELARVDVSFEALRKLNRAQRFKVVAKAFQDAAKTPEGAQALVAAAREAQIGARTIQQSAGLSVNHSETLVRIIGKETAQRLAWSLTDVFSNLMGHGLSASPAEYTGSGSGSINWVINLLDAGAPNI
jgi:hypothetical protein